MGNKYTDFLLRLLYPDRCILCDRTIGLFDDMLCESCNMDDIYVREPVCKKCGKQIEDEREEYCRDCLRKKHEFDRGFVLFLYKDNVRKSIYRFKYDDRRRYGIAFGRLMAKRYGTKIKKLKPDAIIPVPLHKSKLISRGYNQAQIVARELGHILDVPVREDIIYRYKNTKALKILDGDKRRDSLKSAFKIRGNGVKLSTVVLVDDIYTTGSTLDEISKTLRGAGVKTIYFAVVASGGTQ